MLDQVTDADFTERVLEAETPVLLEFWATWCPSCRMLRPVLEQIATEHSKGPAGPQLALETLPGGSPARAGGPIGGLQGVVPLRRALTKRQLLEDLDKALDR